MGHLYPDARIVGIELDTANVALARRNLKPIGDRCEVVEAALWSAPGQVKYAKQGGADAFRVTDAGDTTVDAITPNELRERYGRPDYVKMDIEGAERSVLKQAAGWAVDVPAISVECHPPYALADCRSDLEALGFSVQTFPRTIRQLNRDYAVGIRG
jgi:FkbM family methyltransferase